LATAPPDWLDGYLRREQLPEGFRLLVQQVHAPIARRVAAAARAHGPGFVLGICGAQGSGKSTLTGVLQGLLAAEGLPTAVLSIDDLYLTHAARQQLGATVHPLLCTRGVPGTHDLALGEATLDALASHGTVALPRFDKRSDDRLPADVWPHFQAPAAVVILEGWCVGARPEAEATLAVPVNTLERDEDADIRWRRHVNDALQGPYARFFDRIDLLLMLQAPSFDVVHGWRLEQERKLRERVRSEGGDLARVMDDGQIHRFISHYERVTRNLLAEMPARADILLRLDAERAALELRGA
jgi:D-glycerate 3-kinase